MLIVLVEHDKLKICLNRSEMRELNLDESRLDCRDPNIREALITLLQKARTEAGFYPKGAKVIVELLPDENDGCIIYFTAVHGLRLSAAGMEIEPAVYAFDNAFDLTDAIRGLRAHYGHRIYKSSLYSWDIGFRLVVSALDYKDRQSGRFLEEYARYVGSGEALAAHIDEYGSLLARDNAIEIFGKRTMSADVASADATSTNVTSVDSDDKPD